MLSLRLHLTRLLEKSGWIVDTAPECGKLSRVHSSDFQKFLRATKPSTPAINFKQIQEELERQVAQKGVVTVLRQGMTLDDGTSLPGSTPLSFSSPHDTTNILRARWRNEANSETDAPDLVLFMNGLPVAAILLRLGKSQTIDDAVAAYEPLQDPLKESSIVVYFALSRDEVRMATSLSAPRFFPFNQGFQGHAGNPPAPHNSDQFPTTYFFTQTCQKENWIRIVQHFIFKDRQGVTIFPRFHQWDAVTKLIDALKKDKVGKSYLIEHSAGSGKTNTIAWLAHALRDLKQANGQAVFSSVILVTNRLALDLNLKRALRQIHRTDLVEVGMNDDARLTSLRSKSHQLAEALTAGNNIIIVTVQTFQYCLGYLPNTSDLAQRNYALIIDEAHSLDCGEYVQSLRTLLNPMLAKTPQQIRAELLQQGTVLDDVVYSRHRQNLKKKPKNVSSFAFTATPKPRTQDNYGTEERDADGNVVRGSFHLYPMCQAVEEGFILYPLKGYVTGGTALMQLSGAGLEDRLVDSLQARRKLAQWRDLHPVNIIEKTRRILEHCAEHVAPLLDGQAKIMVITSSRAAVVRYKAAMEDFLEHHPDLAQKILPKYPHKGAILAAFSNSLSESDWRHPEDARCDPNPFARLDQWELCTEPILNDLGGLPIEKVFERPENRILIVAEKFQVGFDQPKLCALYVDKKIREPLNIVQTYSRVNRITEGKDKLFIVDFHNDLATVREAFGEYRFGLGGRTLDDTKDIELIKKQLDTSGFYTPEDFQLFKKSEYMLEDVPIQRQNRSRDFADAPHPQSNMSGPSVLVRLAEEWTQNYKTQREKLLACRNVLRSLEERYQKDPTVMESETFRAEVVLSEDFEVQEEESRAQLAQLCKFRANLNAFHDAYQDLVAVTDFAPDWEAFDDFARRLYDRLSLFQDTIDLTGLTLDDYKIRVLRQGLKRSNGPQGGTHDRTSPPSFKSLYHLIAQVSDEAQPPFVKELLAVKVELDRSRLYVKEDLTMFGQLFQAVQQNVQMIAPHGRFSSGENLETLRQRLFFSLTPIVNRWRTRAQESPAPLFFMDQDLEKTKEDKISDPFEFKRNLEDFRRIYAEAYYSEVPDEKHKAEKDFSEFYAFAALLLARLNDQAFKDVVWEELQTPPHQYAPGFSVVPDEGVAPEQKDVAPATTITQETTGKAPNIETPKTTETAFKVTPWWGEKPTPSPSQSSRPTQPSIPLETLHAMKVRLDASGIYTEADVATYCESQDAQAVDNAARRWKMLRRENEELRQHLLTSLNENQENSGSLAKTYGDQTAVLKVLEESVEKLSHQPPSTDTEIVPWQQFIHALSERIHAKTKTSQPKTFASKVSAPKQSSETLFKGILQALREK